MNGNSSSIERSHAAILALHAKMKEDARFRELCGRGDLPWDFAAGYEPRWYNGPPPEQTKVLFFMAEPGAITKTEAHALRGAIAHEEWIGTHDLRLQEHYWRKNLLELCSEIWPVNSEQSMFEHLGGSCTFWMSLRAGIQTKSVPAEPLNYFLENYLREILALFPNASIVAAGSKAAERLERVGCSYEKCSAFTRPESNKPRARDSWRVLGATLRNRIEAKIVRG